MAHVSKKTLAITILLILLFISGILIGKHFFSKTDTTIIHDGPSNNPLAVHLQEVLNTKRNTDVSYDYKPRAQKNNDETISYQQEPEHRTYDLVTGKETIPADVDIDTGKQDLKVAVNGKAVDIQKKEDEQYIFDKGQLKVKQDTTASLNIHIDPIKEDHTKRYSIGAGVNDDGKPAFVLTAPITKNKPIDGWAYHDSDHNSIGVMIRF